MNSGIQRNVQNAFAFKVFAGFPVQWSHVQVARRLTQPFVSSEVDKMSARNFWEVIGKK